MSARSAAARLSMLSPGRRVGHVRAIAPSHLVASGPFTTLGALCEISTCDGPVIAEVAAVEDEHVVLVPFNTSARIDPDARVALLPERSAAPAGDAYGGRAVDALGEPIDGAGAIAFGAVMALNGVVLDPLMRREPDTILATGIRTIDALLTIGRGQRLGVFSASGVGKTTLIRQLATQVASDRCIVCLVGERGREVEAMWRMLSQRPDRQRFTCVAATSDLSPSLRVRAAHQALCLAEHWRDRGEDVLLIVDSVTRYAMALREIGLAAGAPPTLRAYTPNVFSALPRLVERCGAARESGSITAVFTVLAESDDVDDPIAEVMKSLLDGHIVMSRPLAEQGHFPPIDVTRSVSRQAHALMSSAHAAAARRVISWLAAYEDARVMIESGLYKTGSNVRVDEAVRRREQLLGFVRQRHDEHAGLAATLSLLERLGASHA